MSLGSLRYKLNIHGSKYITDAIPYSLDILEGLILELTYVDINFNFSHDWFAGWVSFFFNRMITTGCMLNSCTQPAVFYFWWFFDNDTIWSIAVFMRFHICNPCIKSHSYLLGGLPSRFKRFFFAWTRPITSDELGYWLMFDILTWSHRSN